MNKILKTLILICFISTMMLIMTGCQLRKDSDKLIYLESVDRTDIYYDKDTKVMYTQDVKVTMIPMVDSEGNILLKE